MTTKVWFVVRLAMALSVLGSAIGGATMPGFTQDSPPPPPSSDLDAEVESLIPEGEPVERSASRRVGVAELQSTVTIPQSDLDSSSERLSLEETLRERQQPATTVTDWLAQIEAAIVEITGVRVEESETGLQVILETTDGSLPVPETRSIGNALIADIPNATIADDFSQANPIEGIALVSVTRLPDNRVRVAITGTDAPPSAEISAEAQELVLAVTLGDADAVTEEDAIQVVVTGEQDDDYYVPNTSVGTRTDTPLRDIPQSIQIVPQQVLQDRQARSITDGLENVSGVNTIGYGSNSTRDYFTLRGFEAYNALLNGLPDPQITNDASFFNVERLEVLKGPASVLYGDSASGGIGGTINVVTRQPLREPFYEISATIGSYNDYQGTIDLSGPLNDSRTVLYRLIAGYRSSETFIDFNESQLFAIAPSLSFSLGDSTDLIVEGDVTIQERNGQTPNGLPAVGSVLPNPNGEVRRSFSPTGPSEDVQIINGRVGYRLEHRFNEDWRLRNAFRWTFSGGNNEGVPFIYPASLEADNRTLNRIASVPLSNGLTNIYYLDTNLLGQFSTGSIDHQLLVGFSLSRNESDSNFAFGVPFAPVDIFDPVYDQTFDSPDPSTDSSTTRDTLGIYLQDQVTIAENLKLLLGGRMDFFEERTTDRLANTETNQSDTAFSPRVGIVYQPIQPISLYASYSRAFTPTIGQAAGGEAFQPGRATQYEIGIRANINEQLSANLALYDLTRTNVTTTDPDNPNFSVQTGEQRSRGIELDISGEILPGWNIIGGYAYTDARVTEDNAIPESNRLFAVPEHAFNLWTTYRIQDGNLQGLGFGLGFYYSGEVAADLANTLELPSYFRTDAAIFYERDRFRAALNFRNIFDVEYYTAWGSGETVYVGDPFTIEGTISWQF